MSPPRPPGFPLSDITLLWSLRHAFTVERVVAFVSSPPGPPAPLLIFARTWTRPSTATRKTSCPLQPLPSRPVSPSAPSISAFTITSLTSDFSEIVSLPHAGGTACLASERDRRAGRMGALLTILPCAVSFTLTPEDMTIGPLIVIVPLATIVRSRLAT
jgi:hypothetical protein